MLGRQMAKIRSARDLEIPKVYNCVLCISFLAACRCPGYKLGKAELKQPCNRLHINIDKDLGSWTKDNLLPLYTYVTNEKVKAVLKPTPPPPVKVRGYKRVSY